MAGTDGEAIENKAAENSVQRSSHVNRGLTNKFADL